MRVFKTSYKDRKGKTKEAAKWYIEFRDHLEYVRRLPGFESKAATEELGRNVEKLVAYHKATGGQVDPGLSRWLGGLPQAVKVKLAEIGLLDRERIGAAKALEAHIADWAASLKAKGNTAFHVQVVTRRAKRIIDGCKFRFYSDIHAGKVSAFLDEMRQDTEEDRGISAQTFNFYQKALKQFCRWMIKDRRATENPVAHLDGLNVRKDRRHDRRPLEVDQLRQLLDAATNGLERLGMTGEERAILYWLAVKTGLRAGELRSLERASFNLGDDPVVTVDAEYSKRRRQDILHLRPALADALRGFLAGMTLATKAFRLPPPWDIIDMFRADLEAAGIPYCDDAGLFADFHSLRHTFITNLAQGGVHPKVAQTLARHSTITLTMDRYSHTRHEDQTEALETLPDLTQRPHEALKATGTTGKAVETVQPSPNEPKRLGVLLGAFGCFR